MAYVHKFLIYTGRIPPNWKDSNVMNSILLFKNYYYVHVYMYVLTVFIYIYCVYSIFISLVFYYHSLLDCQDSTVYRNFYYSKFFKEVCPSLFLKFVHAIKVPQVFGLNSEKSPPPPPP